MPDYVDNSESYVAVPESVPQAAFLQIASSFQALSEVRVVRTEMVPVLQAAPIDPAAATAIGYWVVNFAPEAMRQLALWGLLAYGGKKAVDGFASEAGKDIWKGAKALCHFIFEKLIADRTDKESESLRTVDFRSNGPSDGSLYLSASIMLPIPDTEELLREYLDDIESVIYPLMGCLAGERKALRIQVDRERHAGWPWYVSLFGGAKFDINPKEGTFKQSYRESKDDAAEKCLSAILANRN